MTKIPLSIQRQNNIVGKTLQPKSLVFLSCFPLYEMRLNESYLLTKTALYWIEEVIFYKLNGQSHKNCLEASDLTVFKGTQYWVSIVR